MFIKFGDKKQLNHTTVEYSFERVDCLFDALNKIISDGREYIFRGHGDSEWLLQPSAYRSELRETLLRTANASARRIDNEETELDFQHCSTQFTLEFLSIRNFYRTSDRNGLPLPYSPKISENLHLDANERTILEAGFDEWLPNNLFEVVALAQHYGIPTRMLDWSYSPYPALYFAAEYCLNCESSCKKSSIWVVDIKALETAAGFNRSFKNISGKPESPYRVELFKPHYKENSRIFAQKGLFTVVVEDMNLIADSRAQAERRSLDTLVAKLAEGADGFSKDIFVKLTFPTSLSKNILYQLGVRGYDAATLMTGFEGVSKMLRSHIPGVSTRGEFPLCQEVADSFFKPRIHSSTF